MIPDPEPIPIRLHCPECGELHVDEGEFATLLHTSHACQNCGLVWKPANVPTVGVRFLPGCKNEPPPSAVLVSHRHAKSGPWAVVAALQRERPGIQTAELDAEHEPLVEPNRVKVARSSRKRRQRR